MPTSTEFFGVTAHNLGPLTTTFSAPSACATGTDHHAIVNASAPERLWGFPTCGFKDRGSCMPSGKSYDSLRCVTTPLNRVWNHYYSPGIACPSGWTTAGAMVKEGESSLSVSGIFSSRVQASTTGPVQLEPIDFWAKIMDVSETIAYCCPSKPRRPLCLNVEVITVTSLDGASLTQPLLSFDVLSIPASTQVDDRWLTHSRYLNTFVVATWVPAVPLVHKQSDLDEAEDDENDDDGEDGDGNAASTKTTGHGVVRVLGLTLGILAGMGMLL
ncbi:hypothetical protein FGADI_6237 [Fusarium gaditjirri]|uniref:Uncharacterized protein n=1 Tax=Fusarium gaditjirri TaxID=282569 RepID=A0A8H4WWL4_9HYPO|nr:hypothetical protein FGADI_6237 [Fusarium gaditjirri]